LRWSMISGSPPKRRELTLPAAAAHRVVADFVFAPGFCLSMIFSENRLPPRIESGAGFFRIML